MVTLDTVSYPVRYPHRSCIESSTPGGVASVVALAADGQFLSCQVSASRPSCTGFIGIGGNPDAGNEGREHFGGTK